MALQPILRRKTIIIIQPRNDKTKHNTNKKTGKHANQLVSRIRFTKNALKLVAESMVHETPLRGTIAASVLQSFDNLSNASKLDEKCKIKKIATKGLKL